MNEEYLYQLVEKAVSGGLSTAERAELDAWCAESEENRAEYDTLVEILGFAGSAMEAVDPKTDAAWDGMLQHMQSAPSPLVVRPPFWSGARRFWAVAAAIAVLAVVGYVFLGNSPQGTTEALHFATALGETKSITLPDGSKAQLNGGSALDAAPGYGKEDRRLRLQGEAYFEVAKDRNRPFVVSAGGASAEALGTAFNVRMSHSDGSIQLGVTEGRVRFAGEQAKDLVVEAGQSARYVPGKGIALDAIKPADAAAWTRKALVFNDTPFPQVAEQLERHYGVQIDFPEHLNAARVNANFDSKPLEDVLGVLGTLYGFKAQQNGKVVTLSE